MNEKEKDFQTALGTMVEYKVCLNGFIRVDATTEVIVKATSPKEATEMALKIANEEGADWDAMIDDVDHPETNDDGDVFMLEATAESEGDAKTFYFDEKGAKIV